MDDRKAWSKPSIKLQEIGCINKFNMLRNESCQPDIDGVAILPLIEQFGSPLFIVSEKKLRENVRNLVNTFSNFWPKVTHAWPYKTNYLSSICKILHQEGSLAEIVSEFEYNIAEKLGLSGSQIIWNGPYKPLRILEKAIRENVMVNIDHFDELYTIEKIAKELNKKVEVGIRLNFKTQFTEHWGRFGFNIENDEAMNAAIRIGASEYLSLTGLHTHIGTFVLDVRAYEETANTLGKFLEDVERKTGCHIKTVNIGGGFASRNALKGIYLPPDQIVPSIEQYALAITQNLKAALSNRIAEGKELPDLLMETGRAIVDDAECLVTSVVGNKRLYDGRRASILDAGVNLMFTSFWYNHEIKPVYPLEGIPEETVLFGPLCMNLDVIRSSIMLPPLNIGQPLIITPAGAYNNTQWMQFIETRPAIIMIMEDGTVEVIRQAESMQTVTELEYIPSSLRANT